MQAARSTFSIADALGQHLDGAARFIIRHERARSFRVFAVFELTLKILGALVLIPFWIYLLLVSLGGGGDGGGDGGSDSGGGRDSAAQKWREPFKVSSFWYYHHELVVQVIGRGEQVIAEWRVRPRSELEGRALIGTVLQLAQQHRVTVVESVALAEVSSSQPGGPVHVAHVWCGGRPLMTAPALRAAEELEPALRERGFEIEVNDKRAVLRRVGSHRGVLGPLVFLAIIIGLLVVQAIFNPIYMLVISPAVLFIAFLARNGIKEFFFELLCGLFRQRERDELVLTPEDVTCRSRDFWRRSTVSTDGDELIGVGCAGTLSWNAAVQLEEPRLILAGRRRTAALPATLTMGCAPLVHDWVASTLVRMRANAGVHDFRVRCAYCSTLVDFESRTTCNHCGAGRLAA